jgi:hypothetical protein
MKKRLLLAALAIVSAVSGFAYENGSYVYTSAQKLKMTGENIVVNGDFKEGLTVGGWVSTADDKSLDTETWGIEPGVGPNGEDVLQSLASNEGASFCRVWDTEDGMEDGQLYMASFQIKAVDGDLRTSAGTTIAANFADFFLNTDGALTQVASTDDAPVVAIASAQNFSAEWTTIAFTFTYEAGKFLVMHLERMATGTQITNITVQPCQIVYDDRIAKAKFDFAKKLLDDPNFNVEEAAEARNYILESIIPSIEAQLESGELDDPSAAEDLISQFEVELGNYLDVTSTNIASNDFFQYVEDLTTFPKYNRGNISNGQQIGGFVFRGDNWLHGQGAEMLTKQIQGGGSYQVGPGSVALTNKYMPAGKYYIAAEMRNARCNKDYSLVFNHEAAVKAFVGSDSVELGTIKGEEFTRFYIVKELKAGETFEAGFWWDGPLHDGTFHIKNFEIRSFGNVADGVAHAKAWEAFKAQWDAVDNARNKLISMIGDRNYPWEQDSLLRAKAQWDILYDAQVAKGWVTAEGTDAGIATTEELEDWTLRQGVEIPDTVGNPELTEYYSEANYGKYGLVRGYQKAVNYVVAACQPIADLAAAIKAAELVRDDDMNQGGDKETFQNVINAAQAVYDDIIANSNDEKRADDETRIAEQRTALDNATEAFKNSVPSLTPFVDIDFSTPFAQDAETGEYYIQGTSGKMVFGAIDASTVDGSTNFQQGIGGVNEDVLRVGKGAATVAFDEADIPTDDDVLRVTFDMWVGGLINRNVYVDLRNANGERVAGFSYCLYGGTTAYNEFDNEAHTGLNIAACGKGTGKTENASLLGDNYKFSFDLIIDYKAQSMQGILIQSPTGAHTGELVPLTNLSDNKISQFVLGSNYDNSGRRSWFDNLKILKYKSSAEGPDPSLGVATVKQAAAATNEIYSLSGVKMSAKSLQKGLYIINGKKYVIK